MPQCIIQDDEQDWLRESGNMGNIYRLADLVIVAAGSENSSVGVFVMKPPVASPVRLSLAGPPNPNMAQESFHALILNNDSDILEYGPLAQRAWAFQEWYLAQRRVFIMPGGIIWTCKESELNEWWQPHMYTLRLEKFSWLQLLEKYTAKQLTYPSDRVVALLGIAKQMQDSSHAFDFGILQKGLAEQLLWRVISRGTEKERIDLPSWSWAATGGSKSWISSWWAEYPPKEYPTILARDLAVSSGRSLKVCHSAVIPIDIIPKSMRKCCYVWLDYACTSKQINNRDIELDLMMQFHWCPRQRLHIIGTAIDASDIDGLACLDEGYVGRVYCWPLASQGRPEHSFFSPSHVRFLRSTGVMRAVSFQDLALHERGETESWQPKPAARVNPPPPPFDPEPIPGESLHHESVYFETPAGTMGGFVARDLEEDSSERYQKEVHDVRSDLRDEPAHRCSDFWECAPSDHVVWALLLEKVGEGKLRRVGLAMLYPRADGFEREDFVEFSIV